MGQLLRVIAGASHDVGQARCNHHSVEGTRFARAFQLVQKALKDVEVFIVCSEPARQIQHDAAAGKPEFHCCRLLGARRLPVFGRGVGKIDPAFPQRGCLSGLRRPQQKNPGERVQGFLWSAALGQFGFLNDANCLLQLVQQSIQFGLLLRVGSRRWSCLGCVPARPSGGECEDDLADDPVEEPQDEDQRQEDEDEEEKHSRLALPRISIYSP